MAGDWIKMRNDLAEDPAVIGIAGKTGLDEFAVVGRLHHLWSWADRQSRDGHAPGVTTAWLDRHLRCDGFATAMEEVGWLKVKKGGLEFPNFDRHNGDSAKKRVLGTARKAKQRADATHVSDKTSRTERDKSETREEKRREEKNPSGSTRGSRLQPDWTPGETGFAFAAKEGLTNGAAQRELEQFRDWWTAKSGKDAVKADWQATWRTWVRKAAEYAAAKGKPAASGDDLFLGAK